MIGRIPGVAGPASQKLVQLLAPLLTKERLGEVRWKDPPPSIPPWQGGKKNGSTLVETVPDRLLRSGEHKDERALLTLVVIWWLLFWTAAGLCVGSFLNAVIYRLPRGESLGSPLWSFCPYCRHRIRWYDNLPVISFILLRGQCRDCRAPIATRYVVVEIAMAMVVVMLLDAFFIGQTRAGLSDSPMGLNDRLCYDWPIFLAHIVLFACLLSMSAIDLEHYWVDVRFTTMATIAGFLLHMIWTPRHSTEWGRPFASTAVVSVCALIGLGITWLVMICQPHEDPEDFGEAGPPEDDQTPPAVAAGPVRPPLEAGSHLAGWVAGGLLLLLLVAAFFDELNIPSLGYGPRTLLPLIFLFLLILSASTAHRSSDREIVEAIDEERHAARGMVLNELALLLPAILLALVGLWVLRASPDLAGRVDEALHRSTRIWGLSMMRSWSPLMGLATAATGFVIAGAIGWAVRIVFTLVFGKEAFGTGDIHLMAAAGCVAGWPVVLLGFFVTCGVALLGWVLLLPFKRSRAIPLGPWLSLSFLTVVVFYDAILRWPIVARMIDAANMLFLGNSQLGTAGVYP